MLDDFFQLCTLLPTPISQSQHRGKNFQYVTGIGSFLGRIPGTTFLLFSDFSHTFVQDLPTAVFSRWATSLPLSMSSFPPETFNIVYESPPVSDELRGHQTLIKPASLRETETLIWKDLYLVARCQLSAEEMFNHVLDHILPSQDLESFRLDKHRLHRYFKAKYDPIRDHTSFFLLGEFNNA